MKLQPKLVLIEVDKAIEQEESGVYIQEEWQTLPPTGKVTAVGSDVTFCAPGDRVFFERYTAIKAPIEGDFRVCREDAIFMVLDAG